MLSVPRLLLRPTVAFALAAAAVLPFAGSVLAYVGPYTGFGYDISYPQCSGSTTTATFSGNSVAVIGVTHGRPYTINSCFVDEYAKAPSMRSVYMNLAAPVGKSATKDRTSVPKACNSGNKACQGYNYGFNAAGEAYAASGNTGGVWWLDIETANSWLSSDVNRQTIQGAVDFFTTGQYSSYAPRSTGMQVGVYSSPSMWNSITGNWQNGLPVWYAGTTSSTCGVSAFTGGPVWLVQNASATSNGDRAC
jgi:hypothetical protein